MEFQYRAVNAQGHSVSGQIGATSEREAMRLLRQKELTPLEVAPAGHPPVTSQGRVKRASNQEKTLVIRELATLLQAGVSLAEAVESIGQSHTDSSIGEVFTHIHGKLRGGESFSKGLQSAQLEWPDYLFQLVAAGEHTGKLAHALQSAATQMEYEQRIKSEMRNALIYPSILVFSGIAATLLIFIVVVPKFANLLKSNRAQIPDISVWVLTTGLFVKENLLWVGLGTVAAVLAIVSIVANPVLRTRMLQALSRVPVLGTWLIETEIGRWAAMLSTLLENRVPILKAMELTQQGMRLTAVQQKLQQALREVRSGKKMAEALAGVQMLNVTGLNLIRVGERSGELANMLRTLATLYENAGRERLKRFLILLEPAAILIIGSVIGTIMVAVMLAITSLSNISL
ncbi:MAG: type II secretion system F family protein [Sulfurimicrobium sp.]|nr:type II secretion system F family protein [Sulfurimicrobium sp.]MDP2199687.1 type II secretion system F family protein [Sulfurimicrobium sp.]MDP3685994.1 type II secretion system F family protein [Sulfurimicrobium sp.]